MDAVRAGVVRAGGCWTSAGIASTATTVSAALIAFGVGAVLLGLTSYVPTFLEGALSTSPILAGLALAALTLGWPISASQSGRLYLRIGFRSTGLIGISISWPVPPCWP